MKKIFTLISMALVAMSINAQTFDITEVLTKSKSDPDAKYDTVDPTKYSVVDNVSPNNKGVGTKDAPLAKGTTAEQAFAQATQVTLKNCVLEVTKGSCTMKIVSTPNANDLEDGKLWDITDQSASNNGALNTEACSPKFTVYLAPKGNPTASYFGYWVINDDGDPSFQCPNDYQTFWTPDAGAVPSKGAYSTFKITDAGKLKIGVRIPKAGKNRKIYFVKEADGTVLAQDQYYAEGYDNNNTNEYAVHTTTDYVVATDVNNQFIGYINVTLPVGDTYYMFSPDTQIGIWGFEYTSSAGIETVKAVKDVNAPIYNLAGQKVNNDYKGVVIQNGKKFMNK